ncbi:Crp/Fnr family transcriptional regulator [Rhizobium sp. NFR03]|uniref:Crp/Fnr family transcriptional regulator n=1 Tax=Rhizobium sp. NFR03 TaxID=1566263 RepID=UPI0008B0A0E1|nr:Crp/Fnr family transcriptional regulator [Rhizobium sp. NFR03]SER82569.1 cAMP-binding domain of CRP or a regulatory subunit of cAMP-dependent protein kinases [Rhizobium sp. NFR03]
MAPLERESVRNNLLRMMTLDIFSKLQPLMERVDLPARHVLVEAHVPTTHVTFIEGGLCSLVATSSDGEDIEVGHIGSEGLAGAHVLLKVDSTPNRTFMQAAGSGIRVPTQAVLDILQDDETSTLLMNYIHCCEIQVAHSALANARYNMHERLARWLLMCHDRIDGDDLPLTHEFLSVMLGVRRSGVTNELHIIEGLKAIKATRGNIRILDRKRLEEIAGASYGEPEKEYDRLIGRAAPPRR